MTGTVLAAYLHPNVVSHSFSDSLMRLVAWDLAHEGRVIRSGGPVMFRCGPGGLVEARNDVVRHFLDATEDEWLWMVDSDMGFAPDTVDRLVEAADPDERPVVGALCFALREAAPDGMCGWRTAASPTLFDWACRSDGEFGYTVRHDYRINTLTPVAGTGAACLLVHRSALERIRTEHGDVWFDRVTYPSGGKVSEDLSFCYRLAQVGARVHVHTGVRTTHHKQVWLSEQDYWAQRRVPPATDDVAVIVPVMRRPQAAEPFMATLRASTGLASVYAVASDDDTDTADAWTKAGAVVHRGPQSTFAEKVNAAAQVTSEPWLFLVGDDVRFWPGWLDHAQHVARTQHAEVVGTNDLGNPRVVAGDHATHLLISRQYAATVGAGWDGPGVVCHEGYRHWYVDDEIVIAAKRRGVWAMATGARVEHLHPQWGKGVDDDVYRLGQSSAEADRALFRRRCEMFLGGDGAR